MWLAYFGLKSSFLVVQLFMMNVRDNLLKPNSEYLTILCCKVHLHRQAAAARPQVHRQAAAAAPAAPAALRECICWSAMTLYMYTQIP
jgi:hypothetical protein